MRDKDIVVLRSLRRVTTAWLPRDTRFRCYFWLMEVPGVAEVYAWGRGRVRSKRLRRTTRLVIDGFGSSANTFSREAFLAANPQLADEHVCSNFHSPRLVCRAVRRKVPCIVLIRDPRDAATSLVQRFPGIRLESALRYYTQYYQRLMPHRPALVVATFDEVTSDFPSVVQRCNEMFGVAFRTGRDVEDLTAQAFASIERLGRLRNAGGINEERIARPSRSRQPAGDLLRHASRAEQRAVGRAVAVWQDFLDH